jgi:hypothetical protein
MPFTEDLTAFFNPDDFGTAVTYNGGTIYGIFDNEYVEIGAVATLAPILTCRTSDVSAASEGTSIVIGGVTYQIMVKQPDGTGVSRLILEKQ